MPLRLALAVSAEARLRRPRRAHSVPPTAAGARRSRSGGPGCAPSGRAARRRRHSDRRRTSRTRGCSSRTPRRACSSPLSASTACAEQRERAREVARLHPGEAVVDSTQHRPRRAARPRSSAGRRRRRRLGRRASCAERVCGGEKSSPAVTTAATPRPASDEDERSEGSEPTAPSSHAMVVPHETARRRHAGAGCMTFVGTAAVAGASSSASRSRRTSSRAVPGRALGSFASADVEDRVERERQSRIEVADTRNGGVQVRERLGRRRVAPNGRRPVRSSKATTTERVAVARRRSRARPAPARARGSPPSRGPSPASVSASAPDADAIPKSETWTFPSRSSRRFAGFTSRWTMPSHARGRARRRPARAR